MGLLDAVGVNTSQSDLAGWDVSSLSTQAYGTLGGCASTVLVAASGASGSHGPSKIGDRPVAVMTA